MDSASAAADCMFERHKPRRCLLRKHASRALRGSSENHALATAFKYKQRPMDANELIDSVRKTTSPAPGLRRWIAAAEAACREAAALVRQTPLMPLDLAWQPLGRSSSCPDIVVVLHGLFATAGALRPLRRKIERATGFPTVSFTFEPGCDVATLAHRLSVLLTDAPRDARVQLVGHSLGGVVARYFVQVAPCDARVVQTISLGSPFAGTRAASIVPRFVSRDVAVGSRVLDKIERRWRLGAHVPHTSILASHDQLVAPRWSAAYPHGDVIVANARGHNALLFDGEVARLVVDVVKGRAARCARGDAAESRAECPIPRVVIVPGKSSSALGVSTTLAVAAG